MSEAKGILITPSAVAQPESDGADNWSPPPMVRLGVDGGQLEQMYELLDCRNVERIALRWDGIEFDMWVDGEYACVNPASIVVNRLAMDIAVGCGRPDLGGLGPHAHFIGGPVLLLCVSPSGEEISLDPTVARWVEGVAREAGAAIGQDA